MIFFAAIGVALLAVSVTAGLVAWGYTALRDRRRLAAAFARGRLEGVVRLPAPAEPMPTIAKTTRLEVA